MSREMDRLDSWKAIAEYLQRDELRSGVGKAGPAGARAVLGHSVFAHKSESTTARATWGPFAPTDVRASAPPLPPPVLAPRRFFWGALRLAIIVVALSWTMLAPVATGQIARAVLTQTSVTALDDRGAEVWRHTFPADQLTLLSDSVVEPTQVVRSAPAGVYALTSYVVRRHDSVRGPGALWFFGLEGQTQQSFSFEDRWAFADGQTYEGPWPLTDFRADDRYGRRVAVAAHHSWRWPSQVTFTNRPAPGTLPRWLETLRR